MRSVADVGSVEHDQSLCDRLYVFAVNALGKLSAWDMLYWSIPPHCLLGLLDKGKREEKLKQCEGLFTTLMEFEKDLVDHREKKAYWRELYWPGCLWVREMLISMFETKWKAVPRTTLCEIEEYARCQHGTALNENMNRFFHTCEKETPNMEMTPP